MEKTWLYLHSQSKIYVPPAPLKMDDGKETSVGDMRGVFVTIGVIFGLLVESGDWLLLDCVKDMCRTCWELVGVCERSH
ncbi:unnamed protein product [Dovyalis caffra]|uniref:Uncharacterized protein n=1 Tax=Dovyalis caffra TaxID=77055 RepID=A0AAV1R2N1_9ROSI|nr:unnamed protein product [Dovyalis caffra]